MRVTIIGSGPAAAAAVLALGSGQRHQIEILDVGERLETERRMMLEAVSDRRPDAWPEETRAELSRQPAAEVKGELPQKWMFGSDFPFRDAGQRAAIAPVPGGNGRAVSGALGGFSNAWGAQVMPFSKATLDAWPMGHAAMVSHYRSILDHIPFSGAEDDLAAEFPLISPATPLPALATSMERIVTRYERRRHAIQNRGVTVGRARLAMSAPACIECGLCLTGCPWGLIYSSAHTVQPLIESGAVRYEDGLLALRAGEDDQGVWVELRNLKSGVVERRRTDRLLIAAGGLGTTRIVLNSIRPEVRRLQLLESVQLVVPFVSAWGGPDPRVASTFTLNQVNILVEYGRPGLDLAHVHVYPYNPTFEQSIPAPLRWSQRLRDVVRRRVVAGLGYLPSWASPAVEVAITARGEDGLPSVELGSKHNDQTSQALRRVAARLMAVGPLLDLWPAVPAARMSGPAKSYHFGGSFPHVAGQSTAGGCETDALGRLAEWRRIHLIDGSVLPSVAATTFTLTVMANAHRIASTIDKENR